MGLAVGSQASSTEGVFNETPLELVNTKNVHLFLVTNALWGSYVLTSIGLHCWTCLHAVTNNYVEIIYTNEHHDFIHADSYLKI